MPELLIVDSALDLRFAPGDARAVAVLDPAALTVSPNASGTA